MKMRRYTFEELRNLKAAFSQSKSQLEDQLILINSSLEAIEQTLKLHVFQKNIEIVLPENLLSIDNINGNIDHIKWRDEILDVVGKSKNFLSAKEIYDKLRIKYPIQLKEERKSIKTISSALVFMVRDGRVGRMKSENKRLVFGDISKHFTANGTNKFYLQ